MGLEERGIPTLRVVPQPSDANMHGMAHGGWIISRIDDAASIPASRHANGRVVTVSLNSCAIKHPVLIGDLLSFYARIVGTGRTSITVCVEVWDERKGLEYQVLKVAEATLTFVAIDDHGRPRQLSAVQQRASRGRSKKKEVWGIVLFDDDVAEEKPA